MPLWRPSFAAVCLLLAALTKNAFGQGVTVVKCTGNSMDGPDIDVCRGCSYSGGTCSNAPGVGGKFTATCFSSSTTSDGVTLPAQCMCLNDDVTAITSAAIRLVGDYRENADGVDMLAETVMEMAGACRNVSTDIGQKTCTYAAGMLASALGGSQRLQHAGDRMGQLAALLLGIPQTKVTNSTPVAVAFAAAANATQRAALLGNFSLDTLFGNLSLPGFFGNLLGNIGDYSGDDYSGSELGGAGGDTSGDGEDDSDDPDYIPLGEGEDYSGDYMSDAEIFDNLPDFNAIAHTLHDLAHNLSRAADDVLQRVTVAAAVARAAANCTCPANPTNPGTCSSKTCFLCPVPPSPPNPPMWPLRPPAPPRAPSRGEKPPLAVNGGMLLAGAASVLNSSLSSTQRYLVKQALLSVCGSNHKELFGGVKQPRPPKGAKNGTRPAGGGNNGTDHGHDGPAPPGGNGGMGQAGAPPQHRQLLSRQLYVELYTSDEPLSNDVTGRVVKHAHGSRRRLSRSSRHHAQHRQSALSTATRRMLQTSSNSVTVFFTVGGMSDTSAASAVAAAIQAAQTSAQLQTAISAVLPGVTVTIIPGSMNVTNSLSGAVIIVGASNDDDKNLPLIIGLSVGLGVPVLILVIVLIWWLLRKKGGAVADSTAVGYPAQGGKGPGGSPNGALSA